MSQKSPTSPDATGWLIIEPPRRFCRVWDQRKRARSSPCSVWMLTSTSTSIRACKAHCCCRHWAVKDATGFHFHWNSLQKRGKALSGSSLKQTIWSCSFFIPQHVFCQFSMDDFQPAQKRAFHCNLRTWQVGSVKIIFSRYVNEQNPRETGNSYP